MPFLGGSGLAASAGSVKRILASSWVETYGGNVSLNGSLDRVLPEGAGSSRHRAVGLAIAGWTVALVAAAAAGAVRGGKRLRPSAVVDASLAATLLGASSSWLHHSTVLFPAVAALGPARAGGRRRALRRRGGVARVRGLRRRAPAPAASFAGTAALAAVWFLASRRAAEPC